MELMERSTNFQTRHDRHVMQRVTERKESENRIMFPDDEGSIWQKCSCSHVRIWGQIFPVSQHHVHLLRYTSGLCMCLSSCERPFASSRVS